MILSRAVGILALAAVSQARDPFAITGATVPDNSSIPLRRNINDLQNEGGPQWSLYLRALAKMYNIDDRDTLSFFQIAGIHGMPYIEWNNTGVQQGDGWLGYCPHGENIFCLWHRPYVMLFEQILVKLAIEIAATYPAEFRDEWVFAAQTLRQPEWDWSLDSNVPPSTVPLNITIIVPNANGDGLTQIQIPNPLNTYNFPNNGFTGCGSQIHRCPAPDSYPSSANSNMGGRPYMEWTFDVMTQSDSFESFASTGTDGASLESMHNTVHWDAACGQQFLAPDCSAFDPLFFLHHCHVDKLYAWWEVLNPNKTGFTRSYSGQSRWATRSGSTITPNTPLLPFFGENGIPYTLNNVAGGLNAYVNRYGYTYEGMESGKSPGQMRRDVSRLINQLYGSQGDSNSLDKRSSNDYNDHYFLRISANAEDFQTLPVNIIVCLDGEQLGSVVIMRLPAQGPSYNSVRIDRAVDRIQAQNQSAAADFPKYFEKNLEVNIQTVNHDAIDPTSVSSLNIRLEQVNVTKPQSMDELPQVVEKKIHSTIDSKMMKMSAALVSKLQKVDNVLGIFG